MEFGPANARLVNVTAVVPGFITVMVLAALVLGATCEPKTRFGGVSVSVVAAAEAAGGVANTMPNGVDNGKVVVTVSVAVEIRETVLALVFRT